MKTKLYYLAVLFLLVFVCDVNAQVPTWAWAKGAGYTGNEVGNNIAADTNGNSYVTGDFDGSLITFGNITLTKSIQSSQDVFIVKYDSLGNALWAHQSSAMGSGSGVSIATDDNGNSYVLGNFGGLQIAFNGFPLVNTVNGYEDIFIVKYNSTGNAVWQRKIGGINNDYGNGIALDANGNFLITGIFKSPSIIIGTDTLINSGDYDFFIAKYDTSGNVLWASGAGGGDKDFGNAIAIDVNGNSYVTGAFKSAVITFDTISLSNAGFNDVFIVKYDSSGNVVWAKTAGNTGDDYGYSVSTDANGNVYITGTYLSSTIAFDSTILTNIGASDIFLVKYNSSGNVIWAKSAGGNIIDYPKGITTDIDFNTYITGFISSPVVSFDNISLMNVGGGDIFIAKYDVSGSIIWVKSAQGNGSNYVNGICNDAKKSIYVTGTYNSDSLIFDGTLLNATFSTYDFFAAKLDSIITTGFRSQTISNNNLSIYPNPATNLLYLSLTKPLPPNTTITITDMQGRVVKEVPVITHGGEAIDVSTLSQGVYLLKINGQVQRFVKM